MRAVARDLGVVSSAVYRYVASRDELLTLLVVDGYDELGDAVDAAVARVSRADHAGRLSAIGRSVRVWALAEPATYALLFGSPVPGYEAPAEQTNRPGTRVIDRLVEVWEDAWVSGEIQSDQLIARGLFAWAALFGCISFEVFGQYGVDTLTEPKDIFEHHLRVLSETVGLG